MKLNFKGMTKEEKSWIMYDWANSVYATIMMAVVFPIFFTGLVNSQLGQGMGDFWWGIGTSVSMFLIAVMAPFVGAFADYKGYKRKLFVAFLCLGLVFTFLCAVKEWWPLMLISYGISHIGFNGSVLVSDSFLPDITTKERMDTVSGYGFALGYIGGSTIPFLISIGLIQFGQNFGVNSSMAVKLSIMLCVLWWGVFSIPFIKNVKQKHYIEKPKSGVLKTTAGAVLQTAKKIVQNKPMFYFIIAYFFYIDGVGTVINMSTSYGTTLGLNSTSMILALLVTQVVAFPCAIIFSRLAKSRGSLPMLTGAVILYLFICVLGFVMGFGLEENIFSLATAQGIFWVVAILVGTVQGGIQAISRSHFGKLVPPQNAGEYFGFFDIFGKFASVVGPMMYSVTKTLTGRSSFSILSIVSLFLVALIVLLAKRKEMV